MIAVSCKNRTEGKIRSLCRTLDLDGKDDVVIDVDKWVVLVSRPCLIHLQLMCYFVVKWEF